MSTTDYPVFALIDWDKRTNQVVRSVNVRDGDRIRRQAKRLGLRCSLSYQPFDHLIVLLTEIPGSNK